MFESVQITMQSGVAQPLRIIMIGDSYVGKTSILKSYSQNIQGDFNRTGYLETTVERSGLSIPLTIFDTGGQERFRSLTNSYYRGAKGCVLCFDVTNSQSFNNLDQWLKDIHSYVGNEIACVLVATRCDVSSRKREVTSESALAFAHKRELPLIELSSLDKQNVDRIFKLLTDLILNRYLNKDCETRVNDTIKLGTTKQEKNDSCIC